MTDTSVLDKVAVSTDIATIVEKNPGIVLLDREKYSAWYESLKARGDAIVADVATKRGRDALRSFAAEVRSEKASIKKARLRLTEEWRSMTSQANAAGKEIDEQLETLAVEVRAPLTAWEEAEDKRVADCRRQIDDIHIAAIIAPDDTAATVRSRGEIIWGIALHQDHFGDMLPEAEAAKKETVATLKRALDRLTQEEADRAELAKLRAEAEARAEADRVAAEKAENERIETARVEAERVAAERAEARRIAEEKAAADRIEQARKDAVEAAEREAERKAEAERDRIAAAHRAELAEAQARADAAEQARKDDAERIAREAAEQQDLERKLAAEQSAREANQKHRTAVKRSAKEALMTCGASEDTSQKIVIAIIAGEIPAVTLRF